MKSKNLLYPAGMYKGMVWTAGSCKSFSFSKMIYQIRQISCGGKAYNVNNQEGITNYFIAEPRTSITRTPCLTFVLSGLSRFRIFHLCIRRSLDLCIRRPLDLRIRRPLDLGQSRNNDDDVAVD